MYLPMILFRLQDEPTLLTDIGCTSRFRIPRFQQVNFCKFQPPGKILQVIGTLRRTCSAKRNTICTPVPVFLVCTTLADGQVHRQGHLGQKHLLSKCQRKVVGISYLGQVSTPNSKNCRNVQSLTYCHRWQTSKYQIVQHQVHLVYHYSTGKTTIELVPETYKNKCLKI